MKKFVAATATLVCAGLVGFGLTAASFALWFDSESFDGTITGGYIHFAVHDPDADPEDLTGAITQPGEELTWSVPNGETDRDIPAGFSTRVLADLRDTAGPQAAVVQIDGQSQGNRGLQYRISDIGVENSETAENLHVTGFLVETVPECSPTTVPDETVFSGQLVDVVSEDFGYAPLVDAAYSDAGWLDPQTHYLCLVFAVNAEPGEYENTATATGQVVIAGSDKTVDVSAQDSWKVGVGPAQQTFSGDIDLTFEYRTHRPGQ